MNLRTLPFSLILLLSIMVSYSNSLAEEVDNTLFQEANAAYSRNNFDKAINLYQSLIENHGYAPGVLYNLANSYAQKGDIGKAVLNYERALRIVPGNSDIGGNLKLVREQNGLFQTEPSLPEIVLDLLNQNQWIILGTTSLMAIAATMLLMVKNLIPSPLPLLIITCSIAATLTSITATAANRNEWKSLVVIDPSARLQISPFEGATSSGDIKAGRKVIPEKEHGNYYYVLDETGRHGWIIKDDVEAIVQ